MELAVRTAASPAAIWVIVIVMTIMTAILVSAAAVADSWQVRTDRRERGLARLGASVGDLINHDGALPPDQTSSRVPQSAADAPGAGWSEARAGSAAGDARPGEAGVSRAAVPGQRPGTGQQPVQPRAAGGDPAGQPGPSEPDTAAGATGTPDADLAETMTEAEAPTRPDLPPVPGKTAMPPPRSGEGDRAERSQSGTRPPADGEAGER